MSDPSALCPNCHFPVSAEDIFCGECGFDLTAETSVHEPEGEGPGGAETSALQDRVGRFAAPRSLRRSYFDLGLALKTQGRFREAVEAFGQAQQAAGSAPKEVDILLLQAHAYEQNTNPERAFRAYLEVVRADPREADIVLPHIHHMVSPKIVLENGVWLVSEWAQSVEKIRVSPPDRMQIAAFLGRIHLFLGQYDDALAAFQRAIQADPQSAPEVIAQILNPAYLPPEFEPQADRGQAQFALARIWQALGNLDEALRIVDLALTMNMGEENYPEAPVQQLKADLLAGRGQKTGAAQMYYEAGRRYSWRGDYETASHLLELAVQFKPDFPAACWSWMDAERTRAYTTTPPLADKRAVERSLRAWRAGLRGGWPDEEFFWAYTSRALLCELEARLDPSRRLEFWWDAIRWLELALVFDPRDVYSWAYLGRFFRYLNLEFNGEVVTRLTIELDKDNLAALEERAALLANRGQFDEAGSFIARRRELEPNTWVDAVYAYILIGQGTAAAAQTLYAGRSRPESPPWLPKYEEALRLLDQLVAAEPEDSWFHELRAICLWAMPQHAAEGLAEAQHVYEMSLNPLMDENKDIRFSRGWMAFLTGRVDEAVALYESFLDDPLLASGARRNLGICRLAQGLLAEGEQDLLLGLAGALNPRECDETIVDLQEVPHLPAALSARLRERLAARRAELQRFPTAQDEMRVELQRLPAGKPGQTARVAITAVQARLALDAKDYGVALGAYRQLAVNDFPAKERALNQAMDTWQQEIDALLKDRRFSDARQELLKMESLTPLSDQVHRLAGMDARLALAAFSRDQASEGRDYFLRALTRGNEAQWVAAGEQVGEIWRDLLVDPAQLWRVAGHLREMEAAPALAAEAAAEFASARASLLPYLDTFFHLDREINAEDDPYCLPVVLWVGSRLVPLIDPDVSPVFIHQDIPAMRQRIQDALGIAIPMVRVWDDPAMTTTYQIDFYEQAVASGEVYLEMSFCSASPVELDKLKVPKKSYLRAYDPFTGDIGCWVAAKYSQVAISANWTMASASEYMLAHLESALRQRLANFVGVAAVERLLDHLDARWNDLMERSLPNMAARLGFTRLLRALVREQVPVTRLADILQVGANGGLDDPARFAEMLRAARLKLCEQLPGSQGEKYLPVPAEWEQRMLGWWSQRDGLPVIEPPAVELSSLLSAVRDWTATFGRPGALLVNSPALRPYLRRWIESSYPDWPVLSREETGRAQKMA